MGDMPGFAGEAAASGAGGAGGKGGGKGGGGGGPSPSSFMQSGTGLLGQAANQGGMGLDPSQMTPQTPDTSNAAAAGPPSTNAQSDISGLAPAIAGGPAGPEGRVGPPSVSPESPSVSPTPSGGTATPDAAFGGPPPPTTAAAATPGGSPQAIGAFPPPQGGAPTGGPGAQGGLLPTTLSDLSKQTQTGLQPRPPTRQAYPESGYDPQAGFPGGGPQASQQPRSLGDEPTIAQPGPQPDLPGRFMGEEPTVGQPPDIGAPTDRGYTGPTATQDPASGVPSTGVVAPQQTESAIPDRQRDLASTEPTFAPDAQQVQPGTADQPRGDPNEPGAVAQPPKLAATPPATPPGLRADTGAPTRAPTGTPTAAPTGAPTGAPPGGMPQMNPGQFLGDLVRAFLGDPSGLMRDVFGGGIMAGGPYGGQPWINQQTGQPNPMAPASRGPGQPSTTPPGLQDSTKQPGAPGGPEPQPNDQQGQRRKQWYAQNPNKGTFPEDAPEYQGPGLSKEEQQANQARTGQPLGANPAADRWVSNQHVGSYRPGGTNTLPTPGYSSTMRNVRSPAFDGLSRTDRIKLYGMMAHENDKDPIGPMESLANRAAASGRTIGQMVSPAFYGPLRKNPQAFMATGEKIASNPRLAAHYDAVIAAVQNGSNVLGGATDQGSGRDPNVGWAGGRIYRSGEVYNDWQGPGISHAQTGAWRQRVQGQVQQELRGQQAPSPPGPQSSAADFLRNQGFGMAGDRQAFAAPGVSGSAEEADPNDPSVLTPNRPFERSYRPFNEAEDYSFEEQISRGANWPKFEREARPSENIEDVR